MVLSTMVLVLPSRIEWPSGSARCTSMTPSVPPAPPRFSMNTAEQWLCPFGPLPANDVVHAAGRERHHEFDRPVWKSGLRQRQWRAERARRYGKAKLEDVAAIHRQLSLLFDFEPKPLDNRRPAGVLAFDLLLSGFGARIENRLEAGLDHEILKLRIGH